MSSVEKLPNGRWQARWREGVRGRQRAKNFPRKKDAEDWLKVVDRDLLTGDYIAPDVGKITVAEWWERWSATKEWSPATRERHQIMWRTHIAPAIGQMEIGRVVRSDLQAVIAGSGLAASTKKLLRWTLTSMFGAAELDRVIQRSPAIKLEVGKAVQDGPRALDDDELGQLLDACAPSERAWILLGIGTGVRISEGLAVRTETLNILHLTLHVRDQARTLNSGPAELAPLKNLKPRDIPLGKDLADALDEHVKLFGVGEHGALFPARDGKLCRRAEAHERFVSIARRAGLAGITWHNLRDTAATNLLREGLNPAYVAKIIGNTVPVLLTRYASVLPADEERAREVLDGVVARAVGS